MRRILVIVVSLVTVMGAYGFAVAHEPNPDCNDRDVAAGKTIVVSEGCRVHGDVYVGSPGKSGFKLFPDGDPETGMIVDCVQSCKVYFRYGGGITGQFVDSIARDMAKSGCDQGCAHGANVLVWPKSAQAEDSTT
jgi:hypothetical protein